MNKKKIAIIICVLLSVAVATVGIIFAVGGKKHEKIENTDYVTASEWISMLADHTGCEDIELPAGYEAGSPADAKLISITAMRSVSTHKYERFIDGIENYTDEDYYRLAKDYGLLKEERKKYNKDECNEILARYNEIYTNELWQDDYCQVMYQDGVKDLLDNTLTQCNDEYTVVGFSEPTDYKTGDIIVFSDNMGYKRAGRVDSVDETGAYHISQPEITDVINELDLSDIETISFDDIVNNGMIHGDLVSRKKVPSDYAASNRVIKNEEDPFSYDTSSEGFKITLSVEDNDTFEGNYLGIEIESNESGESAKYTSPIQLGDNAAGSISIEFSDIKIAADTTYFQFDDSKKYAEFNIDMDTTLAGELSLETGDNDFKIPIADLNVPFEGGFVSLNFEVYLQISAKGTISVQATFPTSVCIRQEQGNGIKMVKSIGEPKITKSIEGEVMLSANLDTKLYVLWIWDIFGAGIKAGAVGKASITERDNGMICTDMRVLFPIVTGSVYFNGIIQKLELEFDIVSEDDAMTIWHRHFEEVPGVRNGEVEECSYGNDELFAEYNGNANPVAGSELSVIFGHGMYSKFDVNIVDSQMLQDSGGGADGNVEIWGYTYDITDNGSGYILTGTLSVPNCIPADKFHDYIDAGTFTYLGKEYTVASTEASLGARTDYTLLGDDGITYWTGSNWIIGDGVGGSCYELVADSDGNGIPEERKPVVIENASVFVPYGTSFDNDFKFCCEHPLTSDPMPHNFAIKLDEQGNLADIVGSWALDNNGWYQ